jgi:hypothetical protein
MREFRLAARLSTALAAVKMPQARAGAARSAHAIQMAHLAQVGK